MARPRDYLITPGDALAWLRGLRARDYWGLGLMAGAGLVVGARLGDPGAGLFAAGLVMAVWWRIDSRWPFGLALALLVLIPLIQLAYDRNWLFSGNSIAGGLAVAVWYLLAIGVVRQLMELRAVPAVAPAAAPAAAGPSPAASPAPAAPPSAVRVPAWRRRLAAIEHESALAATAQPVLDGVRRPKRTPPARTRRR